jgi:hypothetical protein
MTWIYSLINRGVDLTLAPFASLSPLWPLALWSVIMGVAAMAIYKYTSSQSGIKTAKDRIRGHFYEVWLFIHDAPVIVRAQAAIMANAARYLGYALVPLAIMMVLFFPLFANFEMRYAYAPVPPGQAVQVELKLRPAGDDWQNLVSLAAPEGVTLAAPPVHFIRKVMDPNNQYKEIGREYVIDYKLRPEKAGKYEIKLTAKGQTASVPLRAGGPFGQRVSPHVSAALGQAILYPSEARWPNNPVIESVRISYPPAEFPLGGHRVWWVWPFLVISMIAAFAVKGVFKVEI